MTRLRHVIGITVALAGLLNLGAAEAQQPAKVGRIGWLGVDMRSIPQFLGTFRLRLADLGYVEGRNLVFEYRDARGEVERLPALAAELATLKVDLIVAGATGQALAAQQATRTIPIVFLASDPVAAGLVTNLARPGGNLTGVSTLGADLVGKSLEVLKQTVPGASSIAVLWGGIDEPTAKSMLAGAELAGRRLEARLHVVEVRGPADLDRAFLEMTRARVGAVAVLPSAPLGVQRRRLGERAAKNRLPAIYISMRECVEAGGLMSYGASSQDLYAQLATYADKILKGAKPGELPVEQPTRFDLVINLKATRALGLTIPPAVLARADQVFE